MGLFQSQARRHMVIYHLEEIMLEAISLPSKIGAIVYFNTVDGVGKLRRQHSNGESVICLDSHQRPFIRLMSNAQID